MPLICASASLSDEEFLRLFDACELPLAQFRHADHLRLAWLEVHRNPFAEALARVRSGIRRFAAHHSLPGLYHETVTTAWVTLIATHTEADFAEFLARHEHRLTADLLHRFWNPATLGSDAARRVWTPPDRAPLPV